jgi:hypothetical protein
MQLMLTDWAAISSLNFQVTIPTAISKIFIDVDALHTCDRCAEYTTAFPLDRWVADAW